MKAPASPKTFVHSADPAFHIPMATTVESLNAAAAAAVLFYEPSRQPKSTAGLSHELQF